MQTSCGESDTATIVQLPSQVTGRNSPEPHDRHVAEIPDSAPTLKSVLYIADIDSASMELHARGGECGLVLGLVVNADGQPVDVVEIEEPIPFALNPELDWNDRDWAKKSDTWPAVRAQDVERGADPINVPGEGWTP